MKLIQRIGYYLGGFSIGLIILAFFLNGKRTSCSYGPESRVLKTLNSKPHVFSADIRNEIANSIIDSASILYILKNGDVNFSKSKTRQIPCGVYVIEGEIDDREMLLTVENCDSLVTISSLKFQ